MHLALQWAETSALHCEWQLYMRALAIHLPGIFAALHQALKVCASALCGMRHCAALAFGLKSGVSSASLLDLRGMLVAFPQQIIHEKHARETSKWFGKLPSSRCTNQIVRSISEHCMTEHAGMRVDFDPSGKVLSCVSQSLTLSPLSMALRLSTVCKTACSPSMRNVRMHCLERLERMLVFREHLFCP